MPLWDAFFDVLIILGCLHRTLSTSSGSTGLLKLDQKHQTHKATLKANELHCFKCETMDVTQSYCMNVSEHTENQLSSKCEQDRRICMVKKVSFSSLGENQTFTHKTWSLERSCANRCDPGCIVIGERNKIHVCRTCCETSLCNTGVAAANRTHVNRFINVFLTILHFLT